jgi:hypothetical protein
MWWDGVLACVLPSRFVASFHRLKSQLLFKARFPKLDVAKSRIQLAEKPPATGIGYIGRELGAIVREQGLYVLALLIPDKAY